MRSILGKPDCPDSAYILVLRGIMEYTLEYFSHHVKEYPTWGCLVFPDEDEKLISPGTLASTPIHKVFVEEKYVSVSDDTLIKWVKEAFPPFHDDEEEVAVDMGKPSGDYMTVHRFDTGKLRLLSSERKIPAMELSLGHIKEDVIVKREVEMCKKASYKSC